ncbi:MAG: MaoC family dehydratase N-terminal domain-containing protein [Acidimicrobiia bacterium]|nr:MaoC family dehydratase N-terminal domain-containing protein [Acidimicrobiia bacterium]
MGARMGTLYDERLRHHIGNESPRTEAVDAVCPQMIRHWVEVMQDENPAYTDPDWAARSRHGGIVAPGAMMQVWSMAPLWPPRDVDLPIAPIDEILEGEGYTKIVATGQAQTIVALARVGDTVSFTVRLTDVSETDHKTRLGMAYFVTFEYRFTNQDDDLLGTQSFTYMRFKPEPETDEAPAA